MENHQWRELTRVGVKMQRRPFILVLLAGVYSPWEAGAVDLTQIDATSGVREALTRGADFAVALLGKPGGFLDNPQVRIPLPGFLAEAATLLKFTGQQKRVDDLVNAMNRAAEAAVPAAKTLLVSAVKSLSVGDAKRIVTGGDNSVTQFFSQKTREPLGAKFLPIVTQETAKVDLASRYNAVAGKAASMGLVKGDDANIDRYVTGKALDGLYFMIGEEEKKIRRDPIGTGSVLLAKVFGR